MARGSTLEKILNDFRAEAHISQNAAHNKGARESQIQLIQRTQSWLWDDYDWPHLRVRRYIELAAGQRYYDMPADVAIDRIEKLEVKDGGVYRKLIPGISAENYAVYDSELDSRGWPVRRWALSEDEMIEVWPIPSEDYVGATGEGGVKVTGIRNLSTFVAEGDKADLDDSLIALFAAAEYLKGKGSEGGNHKLALANKRYDRLRGHQVTRRVVQMFSRPAVRRTPPVAIYKSSS